MTDVTMKGKSMMAIRKIKSFEDTFVLKNFPQEALDIYIKAHEALAAWVIIKNINDVFFKLYRYLL